jgi:hypothetical protein
MRAAKDTGRSTSSARILPDPPLGKKIMLKFKIATTFKTRCLWGVCRNFAGVRGVAKASKRFKGGDRREGRVRTRFFNIETTGPIHLVSHMKNTYYQAFLMVRFLLVFCLSYHKIILYSEHPNTGPSGIRMVIFRTLFVSGFRMVKARWLL